MDRSEDGGDAVVGKKFDSLHQVIDWLGEDPTIHQEIGGENESTWIMKTTRCRLELCRKDSYGPFVVTEYEPTGGNDFRLGKPGRLEFERIGPISRQPHIGWDEEQHHNVAIGQSDLDILAPGGHGMLIGPDDEAFQPPSSSLHFSSSSSYDRTRPPGARFDPISPFNPLGEPDNDELMPPGEHDPLKHPFPSRYPAQPKGFGNGKGKGSAPFGGPFPGGSQPPFL